MHRVVSDDDFSHLAALHTLGGDAIPSIVLDIAAGADVELVWRNELDGLTFRIGQSLREVEPATHRHRPRTRT